FCHDGRGCTSALPTVVGRGADTSTAHHHRWGQGPTIVRTEEPETVGHRQAGYGDWYCQAVGGTILSRRPVPTLPRQEVGDLESHPAPARRGAPVWHHLPPQTTESQYVPYRTRKRPRNRPYDCGEIA